MKVSTGVPKEGDVIAYNYCVAFIDLLGQRNALAGQGLLPTSPEQQGPFLASVKRSIAHIRSLQTQAEAMVNAVTTQRQNSPLRATIPEAQQTEWDELLHTKVVNQYWSDGLVSFTCLGDTSVKCQMNGVFSVMALAGSLALIGLGIERPLRGAIDVAWGVELRARELYGAAVARAYELESERAQYPRIVIGERTIGLLEAHIARDSTDNASRIDRELAKICHGMLLKDLDGETILHYLGNDFRKFVSKAQHGELYNAAMPFVRQQYDAHRKSKNAKLAQRYHFLLHYFEAHQP